MLDITNADVKYDFRSQCTRLKVIERQRNSAMNKIYNDI